MAKRIRILHVITGLNLGGAESWLLQLVRGLDASRYECRVVSLIPEGVLAGPLRALGVPVESLGMARGVPSLGALRRLSGLIRGWNPQVVQTWLYHADLLGFGAVWLARRGGWAGSLSWGIRCAQMDFSRYGLSTRLAVRACAALSGRVDAVTANSEVGAAHHVHELGYSARTMQVLENGVDARRFRPDAEARATLRREWAMPDEAVLVGLVARVDPMKGHELFCRAARLALVACPSLRFVFCGEGTAAGEAGSDTLEALLASSGLGHAVLRLGRRGDVERVLAALDVIALPSVAEGFPNALAEGLACGLPAAALDVGDARAIVGHGGAVVSTGEAEQGGDVAGRLGRAFVELAEAGPEGRARLGAVGRAHVLERYSLSAALARWSKHFERLAAR